MAVHDTVCVPPLERTPAGEKPALRPVLRETDPVPLRGLRPTAGLIEEAHEGIGAFLEIQVRPGETEEPPRLLLWTSRRPNHQPGPPHRFRKRALEMTPAEWI